MTSRILLFLAQSPFLRRSFKVELLFLFIPSLLKCLTTSMLSPSSLPPTQSAPQWHFKSPNSQKRIQANLQRSSLPIFIESRPLPGMKGSGIQASDVLMQKVFGKFVTTLATTRTDTTSILLIALANFGQRVSSELSFFYT